ncbi:MAG TPA: NAD-dependent epimerase/dehydratase family protein [Myxococcota bacterium]|nr:NAD-dependent epimerase/dehydratase family protein [Myxococcota bacterium]
MRVLVTGATGFVGSHSAEALAAAGHALRLLVRDRAKAERVLAGRRLGAPELVVGDVTDAASVARALDGCDAALHAAAVVALEAHRADEARRTNAHGVEVVLGEAARRKLGSIVYVSSAAALCVPGGPRICADSPVAPATSPYARSKAEAEGFARGLLEAGAPLRVSYPVGVVGPDDPGLSEMNHTLQVLVRDFIALTSSGISVVDVRDLAQVHAALVAGRAAPGGYVVGGHFLRWGEVAELLERLTGRRLRKLPLPGALLRAAGRVGDGVKRFASFDFPLTLEAMTFATQWPGADAVATSAATGVRFRDPAESIADALRSLARAGHLRADQIGRLAA